MRIDKTIDRVKEVLLWIYIAAVAAVIIHVAATGRASATPAEIIFEKSHAG